MVNSTQINANLVNGSGTAIEAAAYVFQITDGLTYRVAITGELSALDDMIIPSSSMTLRVNKDGESTAEVYVPDLARYISEINLRVLAGVLELASVQATISGWNLYASQWGASAVASEGYVLNGARVYTGDRVLLYNSLIDGEDGAYILEYLAADVTRGPGGWFVLTPDTTEGVENTVRVDTGDSSDSGKRFQKFGNSWDQINEDGSLVVYSVVTNEIGEETLTELIIIDLDTVRYDIGAKNSSGSLQGSRLQVLPTSREVALAGVSYKRTDPDLTLRCAPYSVVRPIDYHFHDAGKYIVDKVIHVINTFSSYMEVSLKPTSMETAVLGTIDSVFDEGYDFIRIKCLIVGSLLAIEYGYTYNSKFYIVTAIDFDADPLYYLVTLEER